MLGALRNGCLEDQDQETGPLGPNPPPPSPRRAARTAARNYSGPRLAPNAACRASRKPSGDDARPRIGSQWLLTRSLRVLAGSFRGHGVSWARRGLVRRINPCDARSMADGVIILYNYGHKCLVFPHLLPHTE